MIFVFGSNLAGRHGKGAALHALRHYGAVYGQGVGRTGDSYAIPTRDEHIRTSPLFLIAPHVFDFLDYARQHPNIMFNITRIGCGLAGYSDEDIAPMFKGYPSNCIIPVEWEPLI